MRLAELVIPARAEFVSLARLVISSLADDRYEISEEQVDDLKLAVSEACVMAIELQANGGLIALRCDGSGDGISVSVIAPVQFSDDRFATDFQVDPEEADRASFDRQLGLPLIGSLVDHVAIMEDEAGEALRMTVNCPLALLN